MTSVASAEPPERIEIHKATQEDLTAINGIGPTTADRVLGYVKAQGPLKRMGELLNAKRVGEATLKLLICYFYVEAEGQLPCEIATIHHGTGRVNINTATIEELMSLPGIGEVRAKRILENRKDSGFFRSVDDLQRIAGIGVGTVKNLVDLVEIRLDINKARGSEFEALGFPNGDKIVKFRDENGSFGSVEDLKKVPGIDAGLVDKVMENTKACKSAASDPTPTGTPPGTAGIEWVFSKPAKAFFAKTETTVAQYRACIKAGACKRTHHKWESNNERCNIHAGYSSERDDHPMNCVSWYGAKAFCRWAGGRLPTKEEWSREASNEGSRTYPWGDGEVTCDLAVWGDGPRTNGCGKDQSWPVCSKTAGNSFSGLCDMSGNVCEWTWSMAGSKKVVRGGAWRFDEPDTFRASYNALAYDPDVKALLLGFRCAKSPAN